MGRQDNELHITGNSREAFILEIDGDSVEVIKEGGKYVWPVLDEEGKKIATQRSSFRPDDKVSVGPGDHPTFYKVAKAVGGLKPYIPAAEQWDRYLRAHGSGE